MSASPSESPTAGARGLIVAAPASGSGKTVITLALLRHFRDAGLAVASIKVGPDYIDPAFHGAASGRVCLNLDSWAMRPRTLGALAARAGTGAALVIGEGAMGLFDGACVDTPAANGALARGSSAEVARLTGWPVVLVVDARGMAASAAAMVHGFASHRPEVPLAGVIFNRLGGARHEQILRRACAPLGVPVLGCVPRDDGLALPARHLGLVQAGEHGCLEAFLDHAAGIVAATVDTGALHALARPCRLEAAPLAPVLPPLGRHIAVARDLAFAFAYPFVLDGWRAAGAEVSTFSPLADEAPAPGADAVYLPGGYPELHAGRLAANMHFLHGLRAAAGRGASVYGECGGYMVLGRGLCDGEGTRHAMAGLLPLETSFARPRLALGYREVEALGETPLGKPGTGFRAHEFHFAAGGADGGAAPLFLGRDAQGRQTGQYGSHAGNIMGSFLHLIDGAPAGA